MTPHIATLSRRLLVAALVSVLTAAVGIAQPKAEKSTDTTAPSQPSLAAAAGVLVSAVEVGSPAEKAGIVRGDIIISINGSSVDTPQALQQALNGKAAGDNLMVKFRHGDADKTATVTLGTLNGRVWVGLIISPSGFGMGMDGRMGRGNPGTRNYGFPVATPGAVVASVVAGGPADKACVKQGDVIQSVDGTAVDATHALSDLIAAKKVGDTVTLSVLPGGSSPAKDVKVTLQKNPDKDVPYLGIQYSLNFQRGLGRGMMGQLVAGAFISQVVEDSPAAKAGIQAGDVITKVAGVAVTDSQQVVDDVAKLKAGDTLVLTVHSRSTGKDADVTVTLGKNPSDATKAYLGVYMSTSAPDLGGRQFPGGTPRMQITPGQPQTNGTGPAPTTL
jgi:S1-C subfamily serine protease